jgi:hypothetical protein
MNRLAATAPPRSQAPRSHAVLRSPQRTVGGASAAGAPTPCRQLGPPASRRGYDQRPRPRWCSRSQAPRGNAVLAAPAARGATLIAPSSSAAVPDATLPPPSIESCRPRCAPVPGPRRWSVGSCSHAGAWEPEEPEVGRDSAGPSRRSRSHAPRGNAPLAAPAARAATRRWSVVPCPHAGAWGKDWVTSRIHE